MALRKTPTFQPTQYLRALTLQSPPARSDYPLHRASAIIPFCVLQKQTCDSPCQCASNKSQELASLLSPKGFQVSTEGRQFLLLFSLLFLDSIGRRGLVFLQLSNCLLQRAEPAVHCTQLLLQLSPCRCFVLQSRLCIGSMHEGQPEGLHQLRCDAFHLICCG